jgi:predicted secreted protein
MKVHSIKKLTTLFILLVLTLPAHADENSTYNRVTFQVSEQREIDNDEIIVTMGVERNNQDPTKLSDEINKVMNWAIGTAKKFTSVTRSGSDYSIRAIYSKDNHLDHWRGTSTLRLKSSHAGRLTELIKALQQEMIIKSTANSVSTELMDTTVEDLTNLALKKFSRRADQVAQSLGYKRYRLVAININNAGNMPRPVYHADMLRANSVSAESMSAPAFDSGKSTVTVNVSGTIELELAQ